MTILHNDTEFGEYTPIEYAAMRGKITPLADADIVYIRRAYDAVCEVPHRYESPDRLVMAFCAGCVVAVVLLAFGGWL